MTEPTTMRAFVVDRPGAPEVLQDFLDAVAEGQATIPLGRVYRFDQIVQAHHDMEAGVVSGKGVVLP